MLLPEGPAIVTVRAVNNAKESADVALAIGIDTKPPLCTPLQIYNNPPGIPFQYSEETDRLAVTWACTDDAPWEAEPIACEWAVGTYPGGDDFLPWEAASSNGTHLLECSGCLENGFVYFASLRCTDQVDQTSLYFSGGLMPDLTGPRVAVPPTVVTRFTGRETQYWGSDRSLSMVFGFDDLESGAPLPQPPPSTARLPHSSPLTQPAFHSTPSTARPPHRPFHSSHHPFHSPSSTALTLLPLPRLITAGIHRIMASFLDEGASPGPISTMQVPLPVHATQRHVIVPLLPHLTLRHNREYVVHVCAMDYMDHTVCADGYKFKVTASRCPSKLPRPSTPFAHLRSLSLLPSLTVALTFAHNRSHLLCASLSGRPDAAHLPPPHRPDRPARRAALLLAALRLRVVVAVLRPRVGRRVHQVDAVRFHSSPFHSSFHS